MVAATNHKLMVCRGKEMADVSAVTASACTRLESFRFEDEDDTRTSSSQF